MKNHKLFLIAVLCTSHLLTGCDKADTSNSNASFLLFTNIEPINSSNWPVNPVDYEMTAEEYIRTESL